MRSLRTQHIIQYLLIVLICGLVIPISISLLLDWNFKKFASEKLTENRTVASEYFTSLYEKYGDWQTAVKFTSNFDFYRWPIVSVKLHDRDGKLIKLYKRGHRARFHTENKKLLVYENQLFLKNSKIGTLHFECLPFSASPEGLFLKKFSTLLLHTVISLLLLSALLAIFIAYKISKPIMAVTERAKTITKGDYLKKEEMKSNITEIQQLIDSVDTLGQRLDKQEKLRQRMMGDITHELRNPVTIIKSHLEAIEDGIWEPTPERIHLTVSEVDRLSNLIQDVERLMTIEGMNNAMLFEQIDFSNLLKNSISSFYPLAKSKNITLKSDIQDNIFCKLDAPKMRQAINNLLTNAIRYTDSEGCITVSLLSVTKENNIKLIISDTGIGISEKDLPNIFERFYRTDKSRTRASGGMGIGLAVVKAIIEAHKGYITATSKQGEGTTFFVTLPKPNTKNTQHIPNKLLKLHDIYTRKKFQNNEA